MKKLLYIMTVLPAATLMLASCTDWLDVPPPTSVSEGELVQNKEGFEEAIDGVYGTAATDDLYGGRFNVEMLDVMLQNYGRVPDTNDWRYRVGLFDYANGAARDRFNQMWNRAYTAIANCNLILRNIDEKIGEGLFDEGVGEIIKAEALGMRAYLHFDMLRLTMPMTWEATMTTAARQAANSSRMTIPYVDQYTAKEITPVMTASQVMTRIVADLDAAKELLRERDPILDAKYVVNYPIADGSNGGAIFEEQVTLSDQTEPLDYFLTNRRHHLNYYAVCGTLARVHLWNATVNGVAESFDAAAQNAGEVISSKKFPWTMTGRVTGELNSNAFDRLMYTELIFCLFTDNQGIIDAMKARFDNTTSGYFITSSALDALYESGGAGVGDTRVLEWFRTETMSQNNSEKIVKYLRNTDEIGNSHPLVAPMIKLAEMYYIAAECLANGASGAGLPADEWTALQEVRTHRNLSSFTTADFTEELLKEYRKETYAEGQAFLNYKRLYATFRSYESGGVTYGPGTTGAGNPSGIYHPNVSDGTYNWLPTDEKRQ